MAKPNNFNLSKVHWVLSTQFGVNIPLLWRGLKNIPWYVKDYNRFRNVHKGDIRWTPCLHDRTDESGEIRNEYFWQDLIVAREIYKANPVRHVDIGSRIDGFVAHVATFRVIEVFDVRPITTDIPGVLFKQADLMNRQSLPFDGLDSYCDSISCLHTIEHFGLGRYGDPINPTGYEDGIANISSLLKPEGKFYLSTPIGKERVEFNANRVFDPRTIIKITEANRLILQRLTIISNGSDIHEVNLSTDVLSELANARYNLGIFQFEKGIY